MATSISDLNYWCGVECTTHLTDYANVFKREYHQSIFDAPLDLFHADFSHKLDCLKIRLRGIGHSMHGRSLPSRDESLVTTRNMNTVRVLDNCTLEVDCGVQIGGLNKFLNQYNCRLPVIHSGGHGGPSVAGYFLAGGIGEDSSMFGGFWSNVDEILWTDFSTNQSGWYSHSDSEFWKISGSGGRCRGFLEKLRIRCLTSPQPMVQNMPKYFDVSPLPHPVEDPIVWWTIFCSTHYERELMKSMRALAPALIPFVSLVPPRKIKIKKTKAYPEFLSRFDESLCAVSIGGTLLGDRLTSAYRATSVIENACEQQSPFLVPYSSSELSLQSFIANESIAS